MPERVRWLLVHLLPRWAARSLWCWEAIPLGPWAPFVLGRALDSTPRRVMENLAASPSDTKESPE